MNILCKILGHKWKYNFPTHSIPDKAICQRCRQKSELNLKSLKWEKVLGFKNDKRDDKIIIKKWFN